MAFNVTTFKSKMTGDGARPNLFKVVLNGDLPYFTEDGDDEFFIRASSIPGATIGATIVPYFGREVKFAGNRTFADWSVTVINDENFKVRGRLEAWMEQINNHSANLRSSAGAVNKYFGTATVHQLGKKTEVSSLRKYVFQNIFPIDLSEITLDWGDNDSIQEFTCTFAYDFWTATSSGSPADGASDKVIA
tara:strand:- start:86 stop:658 length:573 start_codon:yes stop_codon:yes gene_type:complete